MTEVGGRGGRRLPLPRLHHRALPPRGHAARARARAGEGRAVARRRSRSRVRCSSSPARTRRRSRRRGQGVQQQIAFYGSTPAYRGVLELHGWGDLQAELNALSKQGEWVEMGELIDDEILNDVRGRRRARRRRRRAASAATATSSTAARSTRRTSRPRALATRDRRPEARRSLQSAASGSREAQDRRDGRVGVLLRAEVADARPSPRARRAGGVRAMRRASVGRDVGRRRSPHTTSTSASTPASTRERAVFGPIAYTRASTSGRHFSSNTPSPRSRRP